jgi:hypothetical protein
VDRATHWQPKEDIHGEFRQGEGMSFWRFRMALERF